MVIGIVVICFALMLIPTLLLETNPPVLKEPNWDSLQTRALAVRACFDCHSNQTNWTLLSRIPPASLLTAFDVIRGRNSLNFSEWGVARPRGEGGRNVGRVIARGEMPPGNYLLLHPEAQLSDQEKQQLIDGLQKTLQQ